MTPDEFMAFQAACKSLELQLIIRGSQTILIKFMQATLGLYVEQDKVFLIDGSAHKLDYALRIGTFDGPVWACPSGVVVHEIPSNTSSAEYIYPTSKINVQLLPSDLWPKEASGRVYTPLGADISALVQWLVACWAMDAGPSAAGGIQLPELETLEAALQLFVNPEDPNPGDSDVRSASTSVEGSGSTSGDTSDDEDEFASTSYFRGKLGRKTMKVLPKLEALDFFPQEDENFHRISLNIGACADETSGTVHGVYACVQHHSNLNNSPPISVVIGPEIDSHDDLDKQMSEEDPGLRLNLPDFFQRFSTKNVHLQWPFRIAQVKLDFNELRALLKYCYILAAESRVLGYKNHRIPANSDFETQLRAVCERIHQATEDGYSTVPNENYIEKLQRRLRILAAADVGRDTHRAAVATSAALETGYQELKDVPKDVWDSLRDESNPESHSIEEPIEFDLPHGSRGNRRSQEAPRRKGSRPDGRAELDQISSQEQANIPSSRSNTLFPDRRLERNQAFPPELAHTSTPRQRLHSGAANLKVRGADWTPSADSEFTPSAPARHLADSATPEPPNLPQTFRAGLPLRSRPAGLNLETNLKHEWQRLSDVKTALGKAQPHSYREKVNIEASLAKIDEEKMRIREALAAIDTETTKIRDVLKKKDEDESDVVEQQLVMVEEALDLVEEAGTPLEDLEMKIAPEDWEMDYDMAE